VEAQLGSMMINGAGITTCNSITPAHSNGLGRGCLVAGISSSAFKNTSFFTVRGRGSAIQLVFFLKDCICAFLNSSKRR
jgi:hypothetical protein